MNVCSNYYTMNVCSNYCTVNVCSNYYIIIWDFMYTFYFLSALDYGTSDCRPFKGLPSKTYGGASSINLTHVLPAPTDTVQQMMFKAQVKEKKHQCEFCLKCFCKEETWVGIWWFILEKNHSVVQFAIKCSTGNQHYKAICWYIWQSSRCLRLNVNRCL